MYVEQDTLMPVNTPKEHSKSRKAVRAMHPLKTLIVDDHEWFRKEIRSYLEKQEGIPEGMAEASTTTPYRPAGRQMFGMRQQGAIGI